MSTTNEKVINIVGNISGVSNICLNTELKKDLNLDSLDMVTILLELEECFELVLDESDINPYDLKTVRDIIELITQYIGYDDSPGDN